MISPDNSLTSGTIDQQIANTETQISQLVIRLENAKRDVQEWVDANSSLSLSAAKARAETQSLGRGLGGVLLGSGYRASCRRAAASANAGIARKVAAKRAEIKQGKQNAQEVVRQVQFQISLLKDELKTLKSQRKSLSPTKKSNQTVQTASRSLVLLEKLSEAYQMGLLTQEEYEEKRKKIVDEI
ncbi:SHOCT domain-containing protein [Oculatella sp. FACHB-28]|uniref:SHOCT domain-containing protein n=1 Tax=Oculatella sp. FACHB-28 TaxID=2692845 RepID=UPI001683F6A1|nr:SHOCT domain-containing protein [Oculatella sp. FACHB-28]MBD2055424.1 SHOCT domain-containing protein [Oculatella sp. FACHB-28]